jgi:CheY-like chemotaxis protein
VSAANGHEALEIAQRTPVDLVITDLMMPKMNGWRLLSALRQRGADIPAVIITGYLNQEGQDVLTSRDISGYLIKPIHLDEMAAMVANIFSSSEARAHRILAVDDHKGFRLLVSSCLAKAGFVVETAASGHEALTRVESFRPDLVLLDIVLPDMDGFELARRLRVQPATANTSIILITVKSTPEHVHKAVTMKLNGFIVKPFDPPVLIERIRKALALKASA